MGGFGLTFDWIPEPAVVAAGLESFGNRIRSFREPLTKSVKDVLAPSLQENFDVGGRPSWEPLAAGTIAQKSGGDILVRTGLLRTVAGQLNIWSINRESATLGTLPRAGYGTLHQHGTSEMPARPWAVIQDEDADAIEAIFMDWLEARLDEVI